MMNEKSSHKAAALVRDAGGQVIGRTKLQKMAYLLELAGIGDGFQFEYRHYGPYCEDLSQAMQSAVHVGLVAEEERLASWGGIYSIYTYTAPPTAAPNTDDRLAQRAAFAKAASQIGSIELELAATAAYLYSVQGYADCWTETACRKPTKVGDGRLERAKEAYKLLSSLPAPKRLPAIV